MAANQNVTQLTQQTVSANTSSLFYAVTGGTTDTGLPLSVLVNNLGLTGVPTVPTAAPGTSTTQIASTAYVATSYAPLASPTFTGTPTLPTGTVAVTQTPGNNTTAIATTAFVVASYAPLASPVLTGTPVAPTATTGNSSTQLATTAFVANTFAAPPALGATTPNSVSATTISATGAITPSQTSGIVGTTTNNSANAGSIGEYITATATAVSLSTGVTANATSISLTAGDWDIGGSVRFIAAGTTVVSNVFAGASTTSATFPASPLFAVWQTSSPSSFTGAAICETAPTQRILLSAPATVFMVVQSGFATSTMTCDANVWARRRR